MTNITEIVKKKAKEYSQNKWAFEHDMPGSLSLLKRLKVDASTTDFTAGASFATTDPEMMKAMLLSFAEWLDKYFVNREDCIRSWFNKKTKEVFSDIELVSKYIQFITDKP